MVNLVTDNVSASFADSVYEDFAASDRYRHIYRDWLVRSLAELGRFGEAARDAAEAIRLAEPTQHAYTIGQAHRTGFVDRAWGQGGLSYQVRGVGIDEAPRILLYVMARDEAATRERPQWRLDRGAHVRGMWTARAEAAA